MKNPVPAAEYAPNCPDEKELLALLPQGTSLCVMPNEGCDYVSAPLSLRLPRSHLAAATYTAPQPDMVECQSAAWACSLTCALPHCRSPRLILPFFPFSLSVCRAPLTAPSASASARTRRSTPRATAATTPGAARCACRPHLAGSPLPHHSCLGLAFLPPIKSAQCLIAFPAAASAGPEELRL